MSKQKLVTRTLTLPTGERKYFRGKTAEEAERKVWEAKRLLGMGIKLNDQTTFGEFAELWYRVYKKPRLKSPNSQAAVLNILNNHLLPPLTAYPLKEITPAHIQLTMNDMEGQSASLRNKALQTLKGIFTTAVENGLIIKSPVIQSIKAGGEATEEKVPLTKEQSQHLLEATWGTNAYTFVNLVLHTGLRRGEATGLMWEDLDLDSGILHVRHNAIYFDSAPTQVSTDLKTKAARRDIPLPHMLLAYLRGEKDRSTSEFVISMKTGAPLTKSAFTAMWRIIEMRTVKEELDEDTGEMVMQELGSSPPKHPSVVRSLDFKCTPHLLRHTYITRLFEAGLDLKEIQYLAGHATPDMTLRVYTHYLLEQRKGETAAKIQAAFSPAAIVG